MDGVRVGPPRRKAGDEPKTKGERSSDNYNIARRLPPFAKSIMDGRRNGRRWEGTSADGLNHTAWMLVGSQAWDTARRWNAANKLATLCPDDPNQYRFDCLAGLDPVLLRRCGDADGEIVEQLIKRLLADGVRQVLEVPSLTLHEAA